MRSREKRMAMGTQGAGRGGGGGKSACGLATGNSGRDRHTLFTRRTSPKSPFVLRGSSELLGRSKPGKNGSSYHPPERCDTDRSFSFRPIERNCVVDAVVLDLCRPRTHRDWRRPRSTLRLAPQRWARGLGRGGGWEWSSQQAKDRGERSNLDAPSTESIIAEPAPDAGNTDLRSLIENFLSDVRPRKSQKVAAVPWGAAVHKRELSHER